MAPMSDTSVHGSKKTPGKQDVFGMCDGCPVIGTTSAIVSGMMTYRLIAAMAGLAVVLGAGSARAEDGEWVMPYDSAADMCAGLVDHEYGQLEGRPTDGTPLGYGSDLDYLEEVQYRCEALVRASMSLEASRRVAWHLQAGGCDVVWDEQIAPDVWVPVCGEER